MKIKLKNIIIIIFLLFILGLCLGLCLFYTKKKDGFVADDFLNTNYEKTIYIVWRNKVKNTETHHGFGDKIRGCITLYQYCKKNKINFKIDATDDICGDFLKNVISPEYDIIKDKELIILDNNNNDETFNNVIQKELTNKDIVFVFTNCFPKELESHDCEFAKFICEPKESFALEVDEKLKKLPEKFGIKHFRFNDSVFSNDINLNDEIFQKCFNILKSKYKPTDVLFTNSNNFKEYAIQQLNIKTVDCDNESCKLGHTGYSMDYESVKHTFIEFFIISHASYIETFSQYSSLSNFVLWPAKIYNITIENIFTSD